MENYSKLKSKPLVQNPTETYDIVVGSGSKVKAVITKGMKLLQEPKGDKIVLTGFGPTVTKTITCAEIIKRRIQNLYQNNKLFYKSMEDIWEPKEEGLDRLIVTRNVPAIRIVLSKIPLDVNQPGYQAPVNTPYKQKYHTARTSGDSRGKKTEKKSGTRLALCESRSKSTDHAKSLDKDKPHQTKRFKPAKEK